MVGVIAILVSGAATGALIWGKRSEPAWRPLLPGIAVTGLGAVLFIAMYTWVFEVGPTCDGRWDLACQTNANQGLLTLLGLFLAAVALWAATLTWHLDRLREERQFSKTIRDAVDAALDEVHHNLIHVALAYGGSMTLQGLPMLSVSATTSLLAPNLRTGVDPLVAEVAERITRNHAALEGLADNSAQEPETDESADEPWSMQAFVYQSLRFLVFAGRAHSHAFLHRPGMQDLHALAWGPLPPFGVFRTSQDELKREIPDLRSDGTPVLCWFEDEPVDGLTVYPQSRRFTDLARTHSH